MPASIPIFSYHSIVLTPDMLHYNPCQDVIFPCVIKVEGLIEHPLGKYYLYYAPHDAPGGICLAYADALTGPWIEYKKNPIVSRQWAPHYDVSHVSSPHVLWNAGASKLFLYFHGENDTTRLATSSDGIHFEYEKVVVTAGMYDRISEASYARVFPCDVASKKAAYVLLFMGNNEGTRRIYAAWSRDGKNFEAQRTPLINPPPGTKVTQVGSPWYFPWQGRNLVIFHGDQTGAEIGTNFHEVLATDFYFVDVGPDFASEDHQGLYFRRQEISEDNKRASDACLVEEDGQHWLFMAVGPRLNQAIALALETPAN